MNFELAKLVSGKAKHLLKVMILVNGFIKMELIIYFSYKNTIKFKDYFSYKMDDHLIPSGVRNV